jgi:outer membrane usher protein
VVLSQSLGESIAIVHAPEADNVTIQNQTGVKTDSRGYAVVPFVNAYKSNRIALDTTTLSDDVDIDVQTQTVYPTKGAVVLANFNTHVGRRVVMTLEHQGRLLPFGAAVTVLDSGTSGIVSDNGQVYLTGLAESGSLEVKWGQDDASHCRVNYTLPVENQGQGITQINSQCR